MSSLDTEQKPSRRLWIFAGLGALALHVGGGALAVAHLRANDLDESLGAPAIEIGLELMSPHLEAIDLPPGPDTDASVASPALAEQKAEVKETELPKEVSTEADDPDRVVTPNDSKKPKEEDSKIAAVQTSASTESIAAEATATPSSEAVQQGPRSLTSTSTSAIRRSARRRAPRSLSASRWTGWVMFSRPVSSRGRATGRSTKRRWRWCDAPIRYRSLRRWLPMRD
jgi:hypothetical protein